MMESRRYTQEGLERKCPDLYSCPHKDFKRLYCREGQFMECDFYIEREPKRIIKDIILHRPGKPKEGL